MGWSSEGDGLWIALPAGERLRRHGVSRSRRERRLLNAQCMEAHEAFLKEIACDGVDLRGRVRCWHDLRGPAGWNAPRATGSDRRLHELPAWHFWFPGAFRAGEGIRAEFGRQLWFARPT